MNKNPSNARELVAMRNRLQQALSPDEIRTVNWQALANVAVDAVDRGWGGDEIAHWALGDIGSTTENVGATLLTAIRGLGTMDPPRITTPTPPPIDQVRAEMYSRHEPATPEQAAAWVKRIKAELPRREEASGDSSPEPQ